MLPLARALLCLAHLLLPSLPPPLLLLQPLRLLCLLPRPAPDSATAVATKAAWRLGYLCPLPPPLPLLLLLVSVPVPAPRATPTAMPQLTLRDADLLGQDPAQAAAELPLAVAGQCTAHGRHGGVLQRCVRGHVIRRACAPCRRSACLLRLSLVAARQRDGRPCACGRGGWQRERLERPVPDCGASGASPGGQQGRRRRGRRRLGAAQQAPARPAHPHGAAQDAAPPTVTGCGRVLLGVGKERGKAVHKLVCVAATLWALNNSGEPAGRIAVRHCGCRSGPAPPPACAGARCRLPRLHVLAPIAAPACVCWRPSLPPLHVLAPLAASTAGMYWRAPISTLDQLHHLPFLSQWAARLEAATSCRCACDRRQLGHHARDRWQLGQHACGRRQLGRHAPATASSCGAPAIALSALSSPWPLMGQCAPLGGGVLGHTCPACPH